MKFSQKKVSGIIVGICLLVLSQLIYAVETVTLQLKWAHQFQFAGYYMAQAKGYYQEEGLNVNFIEGGFNVDTVEEVTSRRANFAVGNSDILLAYHSGQPIVVLGVIFQHSPYVLIMHRNTPTQSIHDVEGKRLAIEPQAIEILAYLQKEGVPLNKFSLIKINSDIQDFIQQRIDGVAAYGSDEPYILDHLNIPYSIYSPRSAGIDFYGDNFFTSTDEIQFNPERVKAFRNATIKGWQYAMNHVDETVDLIHNQYAPYKTKEYLRYEAATMQSLVTSNFTEIGYMFEGRWRHVAQTYAELGILPADISLKDFIYSPNNHQTNFRLIGFIFCVIALTLIISFVAFRFFRLNKTLDKLLYIRNQHANLGESMDNISHQWKQPLNELGVQMMLIETMLMQPTIEKNRAEIQQIVAKSHRILEFMAETIDVFRHFLSSNRQISCFDPAIPIQDTLQLVAGNFTMNRIEITHDLKQGMFVTGNATEFSHVLLSLLVNAKNIFKERHTPNPKIHIQLSQYQHNVVNLTIADNAGGILIKPIRRIFNIGVSGKKHAESGLGLYISKKIIEEKMNGTIRAENKDAGAFFKISLPLAAKIKDAQSSTPANKTNNL